MIKRKTGMWEGGGGGLQGGGGDVVVSGSSTGCRCGLRFLSGLLISRAYVFACARAQVWAREPGVAPEEETRGTSALISPSSRYYTPAHSCFYWNGDQKTPSVYDALKHGGELECGIVNLYVWPRLSKASLILLSRILACFTKTDDCSAPWNHVYHLNVEDRGERRKWRQNFGNKMGCGWSTEGENYSASP